MKKLSIIFAGSVLALAITTGAKAEDYYLGAAGGVNFAADQDFNTGADAVGTVDTEFDTGGAAKIAVGKRFDSVRVEGEIAFRMNDVDVHKVGGDSLPGSKGEANSIAYMINALYDFAEITDVGGIVPYAGAGIGVGTVEFDGYTVGGVPSVLDDEDAGFAYQVMAGVAYPVNDDLSLTLEYQYFSILDLDVKTDLGSNSSDIDYDAHNIFAGIRYGF